jgi:hypothetical protein
MTTTQPLTPFLSSSGKKTVAEVWRRFWIDRANEEITETYLGKARRSVSSMNTYYLFAARKSIASDKTILDSLLKSRSARKDSGYLWVFKSDESFYSVLLSIYTKIKTPFAFLLLLKPSSPKKQLNYYTNDPYLQFSIERFRFEHRLAFDTLYVLASEIISRQERKVCERERHQDNLKSKLAGRF